LARGGQAVGQQGPGDAGADDGRVEDALRRPVARRQAGACERRDGRALVADEGIGLPVRVVAEHRDLVDGVERGLDLRRVALLELVAEAARVPGGRAIRWGPPSRSGASAPSNRSCWRSGATVSTSAAPTKRSRLATTSGTVGPPSGSGRGSMRRTASDSARHSGGVRWPAAPKSL